MPLEDLIGSGKYIEDLNQFWPAGTDTLDAADDHLRGIKNVLRNQFPSLGGEPVIRSAEELNRGSVPAGTVMLFYQSTAPVGWSRVAMGASTRMCVLAEDGASGGITGGSDDPLLNDKVPSHTHPVSGSVSSETTAHTHNGATEANSVGHTHSGVTDTNTLNHTHSGATEINDAGVAPGIEEAQIDVGSVDAVAVPVIQPSPSAGEAVPSHVHPFTTGPQSDNHKHPYTTGQPSSNHTHTFTTGNNDLTHTHAFSTNSGAPNAPSAWTPRHGKVIVCRKD